MNSIPDGCTATDAYAIGWKVPLYGIASGALVTYHGARQLWSAGTDLYYGVPPRPRSIGHSYSATLKAGLGLTVVGVGIVWSSVSLLFSAEPSNVYHCNFDAEPL